MKAWILLFLLAGCARDSTARLDAKLNSLVDRPSSDLVARLGTPDAIRRGEAAEYTYRILWAEYGGPHFLAPVGEGRVRVCEIVFATRAGRVSTWHYRGETCGWGDLPDLLP